MASSNRYTGFSTVHRMSKRKFTVKDRELIKQDLINSLNTRKGSRVMQPNEGTIVWDLLFDPTDENTQAALVNDITAIIAKDPRLAVTTIDISSYNNSIYLTVDLVYVAENVADRLRIMFDASSQRAIFQ